MSALKIRPVTNENDFDINKLKFVTGRTYPKQYPITHSFFPQYEYVSNGKTFSYSLNIIVKNIMFELDDNGNIIFSFDEVDMLNENNIFLFKILSEIDEKTKNYVIEGETEKIIEKFEYTPLINQKKSIIKLKMNYDYSDFNVREIKTKIGILKDNKITDISNSMKTVQQLKKFLQSKKNIKFLLELKALFVGNDNICYYNLYCSMICVEN